MNNSNVTEEVYMSAYNPYLAWLDDQRSPMVETLINWIAINTGTDNIAGHAAFAPHLLPQLKRLSPEVREIVLPPRTIINDHGQPEPRPVGNAYSLKSPKRPGPRTLLAIHTDTVFPANHPFQSSHRNADRLRGPGACDAKGGILVMLYALLALEKSPFAKNLNWEILLNPDEEVGSPSSTPLFIEAAKRNHLALLFEPALPDGNLVSARKGAGGFTIIAKGRSAHAGRDPHLGRNAIHALSAFIANLAATQSDHPGLTINTGWIGGGGPANIVPDFAMARLNIRVETPEHQQSFERDLNARIAAATQDGIILTSHGAFTAPPKPLTPALQKLLAQFKDCAQQLNLNLEARPTGGVCDGNRTAAAGLPTLDSLGPRGGNMHTDQEFVQLDSLTERAKLTALFLMRAAAGELPIELLHGATP